MYTMKAEELLAQVLQQPQQNFIDVKTLNDLDGWDSLAYLNLVLILEERLGVELSPMQLSSLTDIEGLQMLIDQNITVDIV